MKHDNNLNRRGDITSSTSKPVSSSKNQRSSNILRLLLHEIQNHLQAIRMEIDLLNLESNHNFDFSRIMKTIDRASLSLQDVGHYCSLQALSMSDHRLDSIVEAVTSEFREGFIEQGIQLRLNTRAPLPLVSVDLSKFRSVLGRIMNLCQVLLQDGGELEIEMSVLRGQGTQKTEVCFTMHSLTSLEFDGSDPFSPFLRVNGRKLGFGLALARETLKCFQAELAFQKILSDGAIIKVTFESPDPN